MSNSVNNSEEIVPGIPSEGLSVLHLFYHLNKNVDRGAVLKALNDVSNEGYQVVTAAILGHKADIAVMVLGPDLVRLRRMQSELAAAELKISDSYLSITEVSEYAKNLTPERRNPRLYPKLPPAGKRAFCFYPMSKRREVGANWYTQSYQDRESMMAEHGVSGRKFSGRVLQLITGSTGLDAFEWGVTLFAQRIDDIKDVVYTLRFDQASAIYAEFGPFYVGVVDEPEVVLELAGKFIDG